MRWSTKKVRKIIALEHNFISHLKKRIKTLTSQWLKASMLAEILPKQAKADQAKEFLIQKFSFFQDQSNRISQISGTFFCEVNHEFLMVARFLLLRIDSVRLIQLHVVVL